MRFLYFFLSGSICIAMVIVSASNKVVSSVGSGRFSNNPEVGPRDWPIRCNKNVTSFVQCSLSVVHWCGGAYSVALSYKLWTCAVLQYTTLLETISEVVWLSGLIGFGSISVLPIVWIVTKLGN